MTQQQDAQLGEGRQPARGKPARPFPGRSPEFLRSPSESVRCSHVFAMRITCSPPACSACSASTSALGRPARAAVAAAPRSRRARRGGHRGRLGGPGHPVRGRDARRPGLLPTGPGDRLRRHRGRVRADGAGRPLRHPDTRRAALRAVGQLHRPRRQHRRLGLRAGVQGDGHDRPARLVQRGRARRRDRQRRRAERRGRLPRRLPGPRRRHGGWPGGRTVRRHPGTAGRVAGRVAGPRAAAACPGLADPRGAVRHRADQRDVLRRRRAGELPVQLPPAHPGRRRAARAASASAATTSPRCSGGSPRPRRCAASGSGAWSRPPAGWPRPGC